VDKYTRVLSVCAFALLTGCARDKPRQENIVNLYKSYDLEALTVRIPSTWESLDFAAQGLLSANKDKKYLFLNTHSKDTVLRETIIIEVAQRKGIPSLSNVEKTVLAGIAEGQDQIRVVSSQNAVIRGNELKVIEVVCRNKKQSIRLVEVFAFYKKDKQLASLLWTGLSHPGSINKKNKELFMQVVNSVEWKKP
jgi:hypothetical protein